jgi:MFS family permease
LTGVVLFDSLTFVIAGLMILAISHSGRAAPPPPAGAHTEGTSWTRFWKEWADGIEIVRKDRVVGVLFLTVVMLNFGGVMIDPLGAAYIIDIVKVGAETFGLLVTVQAIGGIIGGLVAGKVGTRMATARLYGWAEVILALFIALRYNIPDLPVLFVMSFLVGLPAALGIAALETLFQKNVPNTHLGRISGALNTTVGVTSLFGVLGISGVLGDMLGIVPVLNIAAAVTGLTGLIALLFLPKNA